MVSVSLEGAFRKQAHQPLFAGVSSAVYSLLSADRVLENDMLDTGYGFNKLKNKKALQTGF
ncbi:hypothetical protein D3C80_1805860 [compost metagenome]